ncbi:glycoside hydrolase family 3 N-terminal domain-containing protein [Halosolutus gelatinilyticus]|uniref:glycoside hydrolase family 3 N-terminal domain-containing protein n=1 Tax=Halosolutus gelatinilyticus TaxID=2931975 RepID=UPI001FF46130|nr:glycoside hydrolase family 3 N-terminal domain-containing protein [Halosolutus gelatinilyticus]
MTLEEKAAQLGSVNADRLLENDELDDEAVEEWLEHGIGHFTRLGGEGGLSPADAARIANELQTYLREETRLGIPAIPHEECLSGYMGPNATTFPQMIGMASSWNPDLLRTVTETIRGELEGIGTTHALSPVLDVARDLRWGRVEETFGEDPYLVSEMAAAYVNGLQGEGRADGISATLKHFVGHGATDGGKNRSSLNVGPRELREVHLFPYEAVISEANAESVMNAYHDIDGVPCASSEWLLTDVLRGEFGFDGTVVSDYYSVRHLVTEHGTANTKREAGVQSLEAGIDVELPYTEYYGEHLVEAVEEGELAEETLDESVRRVLREKFRKGVFDDPIVDEDAATDAFHTEEARTVTRRAARESMTLLKNEGDLLPLDVDSVAVVGPKADDTKELMGDYAYAAHYPEEEYEADAITPLEALGAREDLEVLHEPGCTISGPSTDGFDAAASAAEDADVTLAFVGARSAVDFSDVDEEQRKKPSVPTSGEGCDVTDLGLPGVQEELVSRLLETETPVVVVLVSGKPHAIEWMAEDVPAILYAWLPGDEGGPAIADVLFGEYAPGGKLPVSLPKSVGQLPVYYNRKANTANKDYVYTDGEPVYPFGYGLSYTEFEYDAVSLSANAVAPLETITASITVTNVGDRAGDEVVQLYTRAANPSQARPIQELQGFERVPLESGESKRVTFELSATQLAYHDLDMNLAVEEGPYEVRIGRSAADIVASEELEVTATKTVPKTGRAYFTETTVEDIE